VQAFFNSFEYEEKLGAVVGSGGGEAHSAGKVVAQNAHKCEL
jgi:hypothetical protein